MGECYCGKCEACLRVDYWQDRANECRIEEMRLGDGA